jgi:hypothetical protein
MIDKKGRLFGKVSLIDLFAVAVLAAVFYVVYTSVDVLSGPGLGEEQPLAITFFRPVTPDFTVSALETGVPVRDSVLGTFLGHVTSIKTDESIHFMPDRLGNEVASPIEGHSAVWIATQVTGRLSDGAAVLNGNVYAVGSEVYIWVGDAWLIVHISNITTAP